jgi:hypothetical protein
MPRTASKWWTDICNINKDVDWFSGAVEKKIGSGRTTKFWTDNWVGGQALCERFPRLFTVSNMQDVVISDLGSWVDNQWIWDFQWRRNFFQWEQELNVQLILCIASFQPSDVDDVWLWRDNLEEGLTVKSCYNQLSGDTSLNNLTDTTGSFVFANVWKCAAPSKVCAFSWLLLLDRIQTKDDLWRRRMIDDQQIMCVHCGVKTETSPHLFLHCDYAAKVWYEMMRWLGLVIVIPSNLLTSFAILVGCAKDKKAKKGLILIWNAIVWVLWKHRNDRIFNDREMNIEELVDQIKLWSWRWFINRMAMGPCLLYEWNWSPFDCFNR